MLEILSTFIKEHQAEVIVVALICVITLNVAFLMYLLSDVRDGKKDTSQLSQELMAEKNPDKNIENKPSETIVVDISGAVIHPGAYTVSETDRLSHVLTEAGGLSRNADKDFFARNYNSAARLTDQQKIYVPRIDEVENGIFIENAYSIDHAVCINGENGSVQHDVATGESSATISINTASEQDLDSLPSIGPVTAKKIIGSRPYDSLEKLVELKILSQKVFDELHERLRL